MSPRITPVLKSMAKSFLAAAVSAIGIVFMTGVIVGEERRAEQTASNQWLARDLATQFSVAGSRTLARAQKYGLLSNVEAGSFDGLASREFEIDTSVKAVWMIDFPGESNLLPMARLERPGFDLSEDQTSGIRGLLAEAARNATSVRQIGSGLSAVAVRLGDRPRFIVLMGDDSLFARAAGGPFGEHWMLVQRSQDGTGRVLYESDAGSSATSFPTLSEVERALVEESPSQERAEFSTTIDSASGPFYLSGMQTGMFGVVAIAMTPLDRSIGFTELLAKLALGLVVGITLLSGTVSWLWRIRNP